VSSHLDDIGELLLAAPRVFYTGNLTAERGAYALEWINAFSHLAVENRNGHLPHGGTLAQLHLGPIQRLSRDVDLLAKGGAEIEPVLEAIAGRYRGRLFTWTEDQIEAGPISFRRFSVFFPSASRRDELVPLKLDVSYLPIDLPTRSLPLSASVVYSPRNPEDDVTTLTKEAFIADKLPTLGFDSYGYRRPVAMAEAEHPEHIWKQVHDISGLSMLDPDLEQTLALYAAGIGARNAVTRRELTVSQCLLDAHRVCRVAFASWAYPNDTDVTGDENHAIDVQHVHAGIGAFSSYVLAGAPPILLSLGRTSFLVSALLALNAGEVTSGALQDLARRCLAVALVVRVAGANPTRERLRTIVGRRTNPTGWPWPIVSRSLFSSSPTAAVYAFVSGRVAAEAAAVSSTGRLSFES
jgi:Nucleotidyl transferase AbiEii toxin, Type IV TA system